MICQGVFQNTEIKSVGLSMISYTLRKNNFASQLEVIKELTRGLPTERTHRKVVVFSAVNS